MGGSRKKSFFSVGEVVLHVCFPGGQYFLSEDGIAGGRFFHSKLCRDMCIGYACVGTLVISFVVWVGFALLVLLLGFLDYCFEGVVSSCVIGSVFLQSAASFAVEGLGA